MSIPGNCPTAPSLPRPCARCAGQLYSGLPWSGDRLGSESPALLPEERGHGECSAVNGGEGVRSGVRWRSPPGTGLRSAGAGPGCGMGGSAQPSLAQLCPGGASRRSWRGERQRLCAGAGGAAERSRVARGEAPGVEEARAAAGCGAQSGVRSAGRGRGGPGARCPSGPRLPTPLGRLPLPARRSGLSRRRLCWRRPLPWAPVGSPGASSLPLVCQGRVRISCGSISGGLRGGEQGWGCGRRGESSAGGLAQGWALQAAAQVD